MADTTRFYRAWLALASGLTDRVVSHWLNLPEEISDAEFCRHEPSSRRTLADFKRGKIAWGFFVYGPIPARPEK